MAGWLVACLVGWGQQACSKVGREQDRQTVRQEAREAERERERETGVERESERERERERQTKTEIEGNRNRDKDGCRDRGRDRETMTDLDIHTDKSTFRTVRNSMNPSKSISNIIIPNLWKLKLRARRHVKSRIFGNKNSGVGHA